MSSGILSTGLPSHDHAVSNPKSLPLQAPLKPVAGGDLTHDWSAIEAFNGSKNNARYGLDIRSLNNGQDCAGIRIQAENLLFAKIDFAKRSSDGLTITNRWQIEGKTDENEAGSDAGSNFIVKCTKDDESPYATDALKLFRSNNSCKIGGPFGCNAATPQAPATVNAASTDLATVVALCNQLRAALIANGICV